MRPAIRWRRSPRTRGCSWGETCRPRPRALRAPRSWPHGTVPSRRRATGSWQRCSPLSPDLGALEGGEVVWPKAYGLLWTALDPATSTARRLSALERFLTGWYPQMEAEGGAQSGRLQRNNLRYVGHWCLEAAAAVVLTGLDDESVRGHPNYPADLVDFWRAALVASTD